MLCLGQIQHNTSRERRRLKVMRPPIHNPTKPHCFLTRASTPEASRTNVSEETPCTWQPWLACTAPGLPQESLVRDETRTALPAKPSLTRKTLGQLCVAPRTSRSRPVTTEPGREPSVSDVTAGAAVQHPQRNPESPYCLHYQENLRLPEFPRESPRSADSPPPEPM